MTSFSTDKARRSQGCKDMDIKKQLGYCKETTRFSKETARRTQDSKDTASRSQGIKDTARRSQDCKYTADQNLVMIQQRDPYKNEVMCSLARSTPRCSLAKSTPG